MRQFSARWWNIVHKTANYAIPHSHERGVQLLGLCVDCIMGVPLYDYSEDVELSKTAQYLSEIELARTTGRWTPGNWASFFAATQSHSLIIDTFTPAVGDIGRDYNGPLSPTRVWTGDRWHPYFEVLPRKTKA